MKTEVVRKSELFGVEISQKSKSEFFSATDLIKAGNKWRVSNMLEPFNLPMYYQQKGTKEFITELEAKFGTVKIAGKGRGKHSWVHPLLFIDIALALNPKLKVEVYEWLFDHLIRNRNESGDSYKKMCGALYAHCSAKTHFNQDIKVLANFIKTHCGLKENQAWETASEVQLKLRDRIHENIALLADVLNNNKEAIRIGIVKAMEIK